LFIGVTTDLPRRMQEHKDGKIPGFSQKYKLKLLVYTEEYFSVDDAIQREKQLKNWHRPWKINLIEEQNPA
jgi:putative endonuclease